ncbi:DUF6482 family protein [Marinobacter lacisalsi]|uniref:DUF6482 family protein n=1 Tax=Marinobacter lacisalsi TaxID=475979 RepID=A0ABV8QAU2_9GAMM
MRITLAELYRPDTGAVTLMELISLEGQRYMARLRIGDQTLVLSDADGHTRLFRSSWEAQDTLRDIPIARTDVVHASAYNEMVGMDPAPVAPMRIQLQRQDR